MSSLRLLVLLPIGAADAARYRYLALPLGSGADTATPPLASANAATLPDPGPLGETVAMVPLAALSWHRVRWPRQQPTRGPRAAAVLAGLLEEHLLDEPAALHFALEPDAGSATETTLWVAACDRGWLQGHLDALAAAGRPVRRIVPEAAPEAAAEPQAPAWLLRAIDTEPTAMLIVSGRDFAGGIARVPLTPDGLAAATGGAALPEDVRIEAEPAVVELAERILQRRVTVRTAAQALQAAADSRWNLAQFGFSRLGAGRWSRPLAALRALTSAPSWQPVRRGLALLLAANVLGLPVWAWQEQRTLRALEQRTRETVAAVAPDIGPLVDPPRQLERAVRQRRATRGVPGPADLEPLLATLATAANGASLARIDFDPAGSELAPVDEAASSALQQRLAAAGWRVRRSDDGTVRIEAAATPTGGAR